MKQKDLNKQFNGELDRLKEILFPKKNNKVSSNRQLQRELETTQKFDDVCIKNEIRKLREQIYSMFNKQKKEEAEYPQTQRAYLDGINKLSKGLKDYSKQINQVFQDFLEHLPTNLIAQKKNYSNHYFVSMLIQNCIWTKIDHILKRPITQGFKAIYDESVFVKIQKESQIKIRGQRQLKFKNRNLIQINSFFTVWRFKSKCITMHLQNEQYLKQNSLENQRKIIQNTLQLPMFVLLLQEVSRQNSDICQILLFDEKTKKFCKFLQDTNQFLNTSLQTVTQRSLLHAQSSNRKFKRHEFDAVASLTKLCMERKQILFISNLLKHPDYNQKDSNCNWQITDKSKGQLLKFGVILYPLFNNNEQIIGVLRQYFLQKNMKALSSSKISKISMLLELGTNLESHTRNVAKEAIVLKQSYYMKIISLIKRLENVNGDDKSIIGILEEDLKRIFQIRHLSVFMVQKRQNIFKNQIVLRKIWGNSDNCQFLLSIVDKLINQESNHIYIQNRVVIYSNMMLFDLQLNQTQQQQSSTPKLLPVQLIATMMGKVQNIISRKHQQYKIFVNHQQIVLQNKKKELNNIFQKQFQSQSMIFLSKLTPNQRPYHQIQQYMFTILDIYSKVFSIQIAGQRKVTIGLQYFKGNFKRQKTNFILKEYSWQEVQSPLINIGLKVQINKLMNITIQCQVCPKLLYQKIQKIIKQYLKQYIYITQKQTINTYKFKIFQDTLNAIMYEVKYNEIDISIPKKAWELKHTTLIYSKFKQILDEFVSLIFLQNQSVFWGKETPSQKNQQEWKQIIYNFVFNDPETIKIVLVHNSIENIKQYKQFQIISGRISNKLQKQCQLSIYISNRQLKSKISYDSPLLFKLPIIYYIEQQQCNLNIKKKMCETLQLIKSTWIDLCKSLIEGASKIDAKTKGKASNKMIKLIQQMRLRFMSTNYSKIKNYGLFRLNQFNNIKKSMENIQKYIMKYTWKCFNKLRTNYISKQQTNKINKIYQQPLEIIIKVLSINTIAKPFYKILQICSKQKNILFKLNAVQNLIKNKMKYILQTSFVKIHYKSKLPNKFFLPINILINVYLTKLWKRFNEIKNQSNYQFTNKQQSSLQLLPQSVTSIKQLQKIIATATPEYNLYLILDSFTCFPLYSIYEKYQLVQIEQVNNPSQQFTVYQIGSSGQLIWHYFLKETQNCYKVKDKLNSLSKFTEEAIRNCKSLMEKNTAWLTIFRNKWKQTIKSKYWKVWRTESQLQGILDRNRLNDCLYQINLESQTMREKLKMQEKMLKNNVLLFEQIKDKKEQYQRSICFSQSQVAKIDESYIKLQNTRNIYMTLHKRTVLKSCMLIWRSNSQKIKLSHKQDKLRNNKSINRIALNSIFSILQPKCQLYLQKYFHVLHNFKSYGIKIRQIQKIPVSFDQKSQRLITFQSQIPDKQNSSQNSNRSQSPQSKVQSYKSLNKYKLNELKAEKKISDLSAQEMSKYNNGVYKLNPKTLKFLKRMGKLQNRQ